MIFVRARRNDLTSLFWADLVEDLQRNPRDDVPHLIADLAAGDVSIVCEPADAADALAWARALSYWPRVLPDEHAPMYVLDTNAE